MEHQNNPVSSEVAWPPIEASIQGAGAILLGLRLRMKVPL